MKTSCLLSIIIVNVNMNHIINIYSLGYAFCIAQHPSFLVLSFKLGVGSFFWKETENVLGFADHMVSFATAQLCCGSMEVAIDKM